MKTRLAYALMLTATLSLSASRPYAQTGGLPPLGLDNGTVGLPEQTGSLPPRTSLMGLDNGTVGFVVGEVTWLVVADSEHAGLSISKGDYGVVYIEEMIATPPVPPAGAGEFAELRWTGKSGFRSVVRYERRAGQPINVFLAHFESAVMHELKLNPMAVATTGPRQATLKFGGRTLSMPAQTLAEPGMASMLLDTFSTPEFMLATPPVSADGVMSISWGWDHDGDPETEPLTMTASVERREGESAPHAAHRLNVNFQAMLKRFPIA